MGNMLKSNLAVLLRFNMIGTRIGEQFRTDVVRLIDIFRFYDIIISKRKEVISLKNGSFFRPEVLWLSPLWESNLLCKPHKTSSISRKAWS